jgi:cleavage stimulation factor subunit 2
MFTQQLIQQNPDQARQILMMNPSLSYAILQSQAILGMITPQTVQRLLANKLQQQQQQQQQQAPPQQTPLQMPPQQYPQAGSGMSMMAPPSSTQPTPQAMQQQHYANAQPMSGGGFAQAPPMMSGAYGMVQPSATAGVGMPMQQPAAMFDPNALASLPDQDRQLLQLVIAMTPQQIDALPEEQRRGVEQLRRQLGLSTSYRM